MDKNYKQMKVWHGLLALGATVLILVVAAPAVLAPFGLYGTLLAEWMLLAAVLLIVFVCRGNPKDIFPLKKPVAGGVFGTILMWIGAILLEMTLILILSIFFSEKVMNVNVGLSTQMLDVPFVAAFVIVAVTPAICEEAVFRGLFLKSLHPEKSKTYKWAAIVICGMVFGLFHGDPIRFVPTAISGALMAYILLETGNMLYNGLFHFINNLLPLLILFGMEPMYEQMGVWDTQGVIQSSMLQNSSSFMMSAGLYMMMSAAAPACLYIGNYLLHSHMPGYRTKLFPSGKPGVVVGLILVSTALFAGGVILTAAGIISFSGLR